MQAVLGLVPENASCPVMSLSLLRSCVAGTGQKLDKDSANTLSVQVIGFLYRQMFLWMCIILAKT